MSPNSRTNSTPVQSGLFTTQASLAHPDIIFQQPSLSTLKSNRPLTIKSGDFVESKSNAKRNVLLIIAALVLIAVALIIVFASIKPCSFTKCHWRASKCIDRYPFWAQCICDAGYAGNGKSECVECGRVMIEPNVSSNSSRSRIVGGSTALQNSWPYSAYIVQNYKGVYRINSADYLISYVWTCGATIINRFTVVTAGHCIHDKYFEHTVTHSDGSTATYMLRINWNRWYPNLESTLQTYVGVYDVSKLNYSRSLRIRRVAKHESYDESNLLNDLAVIQVDEPIDLTPQTQYACLPGEISPSYPPANKNAYVIGWGRISENGVASNLLKNAQINIYDRKACMKVELEVEKNFESQVCAGTLDGSADSCQGDSGGGLFVPEVKFNNETDSFEKRMFLAGVVSYGDGCAQKDRPGIYTRTSYFLDFIRRNSDF